MACKILVMDYRIQRVHTDWPTARCYHAYDSRGKLVLVADHGTPWLVPDPQQQMRFGLPSGDELASMDLTWSGKRSRNGRQHVAYAIILDHAVYAIINKYWEETADPEEKPPYYVLEISDMLWLALGKEGDSRSYAFYDEVPSDLMIYDRPQQSDLPEPIGHLYQGLGVYDFNVVMPLQAISRPALVMLALAFLVDVDFRS